MPVNAVNRAMPPPGGANDNMHKTKPGSLTEISNEIFKNRFECGIIF